MKEQQAMQNKKFEHMDQLFRNAMGSLPEEKPGDGEWSAMKQRIAGEGLLKDKTRIRPLFLLFTLLAITGVSAFYFLEHAGSKQDQQLSEPVSGVTSSVLKDRRQADASKPVQDEEVSATDVSRPAEKAETPGITISQPVNATHEMTAPERSGSERMSAALVKKENVALMNRKTGLRQKKAKDPSSSIFSRTENTIVDQQFNETSSAITSFVTAGKGSPASEVISVELPGKINAPVVLQQLNNDTTVHRTDSMNVIRQVEKITPQKRQRFTVGLYISKDANTYLLKTKTADGAVVESSTAIRGEESFWQYTTGITAGYAVHKRMTLQTGIFFSQKKKITAKNSYVGFKEDTALNRHYANYQYNLNADYLEFTVKLKYYYAGTGPWRFYAAPGLCAGMNFPIRSDRSYFLREEHNQGITQSDRILLEPFSMGLDVTGALGVERKIKQNWIIYAEPSYRYGLDPVIRHRSYSKIPVEHYLRAFGMGFGATYSF